LIKKREHEKLIFPPGFKVSKNGIEDSLSFLKKVREERLRNWNSSKRVSIQLNHEALSSILSNIKDKKKEASTLISELGENLSKIFEHYKAECH